MVRVNVDFSKAAEAPDNSGGYFIPEGIYEAILYEVEERTTKAGDGTYLNCQFMISGAKYNGFKIYKLFTLTNPSPKAEATGAKQLTELSLAAIGKPEFEDTDELLNKPLNITVKNKPHWKNSGELQSEIVFIEPLSAREQTISASPSADFDEIPF